MTEQDKNLINKWQDRINLGLKYRMKYSSEQYWKKFREHYRGKWDARLIPINRIFSIGKSIVSRIYFRTPTVMVTPMRPEFFPHALVIEAIDNWLIRELTLKNAMKRAATDTYLCGIGPIKLGYDSEFGFLPDQALDVDTSTATQFGTKTGENIEYKVNIKPGMPWALRARPDDVIVPYGYSDPLELPWIGHAVFRPLEDVKQDQKYSSRARNKLTGGYSQQKLKSPFMNREVGQEDYCLLWEIREASTNKIMVICEDQLLLKEDDALQIEGFPWEFICYNQDPDHFWGISDVFINYPQQKEMNEIRLQASKNRRFSIIKFLYQKGVIKIEDLNKLLSSEIEDIGCGIEFDADSIAAAMQVLQPHSTTADTTEDMKEVEKDLRETVGMGMNQLGEMSPYHGKTATEAEIVERAAETRLDERRDHNADILSNIIRKWNQYIFKYWSGEKVIEVAGPDGKRYWVEYTGEQLKGEYMVRIDPDAGLPVSRGMRYQLSKELLEILRGDPDIDQVMLKRLLLRQFDWLDPVTANLVRAQLGATTQPAQQMPFQDFQQKAMQGGMNAVPQLQM